MEELFIEAVECQLCIDDPTGESCDCKNMTKDEIEAFHQETMEVALEESDFELSNSSFVLGIDPGHEGVIAGLDPGAVSFNLKEAAVVLEIALEAKKILEAEYQNATAKMTRVGNAKQNLTQKCTILNNAKVSATISVHINSFSNPNSHGYEDFTYNGPIQTMSSVLQKAVNKHMVAQLPELHNRGMKRANLGMVRMTKSPSVLVEVGFISNKRENDLLRNKDFIQRAARGLVLGAAEAFKLKKKATAPTTPNKPVTPSKPATPNKPAPVNKKPTRDEVSASVGDSLRADVLKAYDLGITDGSKPNDAPTRAHVMAMMGRLAKKIESGEIKAK